MPTARRCAPAPPLPLELTTNSGQSHRQMEQSMFIKMAACSVVLTSRPLVRYRSGRSRWRKAVVESVSGLLGLSLLQTTPASITSVVEISCAFTLQLCLKLAQADLTLPYRVHSTQLSYP